MKRWFATPALVVSLLAAAPAGRAQSIETGLDFLVSSAIGNSIVYGNAARTGTTAALYGKGKAGRSTVPGA